ncbi:hypothetical protein ACWHLZ_37980 [Streptomyces chartreusis]
MLKGTHASLFMGSSDLEYHEGLEARRVLDAGRGRERITAKPAQHSDT